MRISIIGTGLFKSGGMKIICEYANRLSKKGHEVIYYYPLKQYEFGTEKFTSKTRRYYGALKDFLFNVNNFRKFYNIEFKLQAVPMITDRFIKNAEIVMATQWPSAYDVSKLSDLKGKKFYFLQDYEVWGSDVKRVNDALFLDLKKITISNYNKQFFKNNFKIDTEVILNGIDYSLYNVSQKSFDKDCTVICFIEHHLESKGVVNAVEAVKKISEHCKDKNLKFICFGQHKYHNIPQFVEFYKDLSDSDVVKYIYGKSDIFIYPSIKEGFALPPAEAMACRCAVVTTTVGAVPEYSTHARNAIHVKANDPDAICSAVIELLNDKNKIKELSDNAYVDIREKLNWDESVARMETLFLGK